MPTVSLGGSSGRNVPVRNLYPAAVLSEEMMDFVKLQDVLFLVNAMKVLMMQLLTQEEAGRPLDTVDIGGRSMAGYNQALTPPPHTHTCFLCPHTLLKKQT